MRIPFGEFAPDQADQNREVATEANNCIAGTVSYTPLKGVGAADHSISSNACYYGVMVNYSSASLGIIVSSSNTKIFGDGVDITKVGFTYEGNLAYGNRFVTWKDKLLIAGGGASPPQQIDIVDIYGGVTLTTDIGGSPPPARCCSVIKDFVVLGGVYSGGNYLYNRVQWSAFNDYEGWTPGTNQSDFQDMKESSPIWAIAGNDVGVIFQEKTVTRMTYVGSPLIFQFDKIEGAKGTRFGRSVVQVGNDTYYLSEDGFYILKDGVSSIPIGSNKINKWFFDNFGNSGVTLVPDYNLYVSVIGAFDKKNNNVVWSFSTTDNSDTISNSQIVNNKLLIYSIDTNKFTTADMVDTLSIMTVDPVFNSTSDKFEGYGIGVLKLNGSNTDVHFLNGSTLSATIETGEYSQENTLTEITEIRPLIDGTATVTTETRNLLSDSVTSTGPTSTDSSGKANVRTNARYTRIKCTTSGDFTQAVGVEVKARKGGKR